MSPGAVYPVSEHLASVILVDTLEVKAIGIDYHAHLETEADGQGNLAAASLTVAAGTAVPAGTATALVILDVFPLYEPLLSE